MSFKKMVLLFGLKTALIFLLTITLGIPNFIKKIKAKISEIENLPPNAEE